MRKFFIFGASLILLLALLFILKRGGEKSFCANQISCIKDLSGTYDKTASEAQFADTVFPVPKQIARLFPQPKVLGNTTGEKRIEINLSTQKLSTYEGDRLVYDFPVSTGKWYETPTGTFYIWVKLRHTRMSGGNPAIGTYYNLPNVPFTMFFANNQIPKAQGFGIHGAYWHNNFGHPMSHGCVNMRPEDAEKLFYWAGPPASGHTTYADSANSGTKIIIYGQTPKES